MRPARALTFYLNVSGKTGHGTSPNSRAADSRAMAPATGRRALDHSTTAKDKAPNWERPS